MFLHQFKNPSKLCCIRNFLETEITLRRPKPTSNVHDHVRGGWCTYSPRSEGCNLHLHWLQSEEMRTVMVSVLNLVLSVQIADTVSYCKGTGPISEKLQLIL